MSYRCGPSDWIDLAPTACDELRQARRCLNKALIMVAEEKEIEKDWSTK